MRNREEQARLEGMSYAIRFLDSHDGNIEALREDIKRRGAYNIPIAITKSQEQDFIVRAKNMVLDTILIMTMMVLHDEFGFGHDRLMRFKKRFNLKTECLGADYTTWDDQMRILKEECGIETAIRYNN